MNENCFIIPNKIVIKNLNVTLKLNDSGDEPPLSSIHFVNMVTAQKSPWTT